MSNTLKLGNGQWATGKDTLLGYNSENNNIKPLPFSFSRDSSATVVNKDGLIETVGSGEPRIDFKDNTKGALLLEPQRSNLFTYSEDFSQSYWNKNSASVTLTSEIAPNGTSNSVYNLVGTAANLWSAGTIGTQHTISFYIKSNGQGKDKFKLRLGNNTSIEYTATNEWVRYEYTDTPTTSVYSITTSSAPNDEYDLLVWGGQSEVGSYATSYIPTSGSAVTRVADACNNGGNEQVINSTEGVLYACLSDIKSQDFDSIVINNGIADENNQVRIWFYNNTITYQYKVGSNSSAQITTSTIDLTLDTKIACSWKLNEFKLFVNGSKINQDLLGNVLPIGTLESVQFKRGNNTGNFYGKTKDIRVYTTALSDVELTALTQ